jgi:glucan phosphorylase
MNGSNAEISEDFGEQNMIIFGERVEGVTKLKNYCIKESNDM